MGAPVIGLCLVFVGSRAPTPNYGALDGPNKGLHNTSTAPHTRTSLMNSYRDPNKSRFRVCLKAYITARLGNAQIASGSPTLDCG